jgi:NAD(P)-dependent dehydrogenase (short-subunit alcohol dehydrogenase family)
MSGRAETPRAFLTGASSGIGRALAVELARRGWSVALAARRTDALEAVARVADPARQRTIVVPLDVRRIASIAPAVDRASEQLGGLDAVVANAGIGIPGFIEAAGIDELREVLEVNVLGALETLRAGLAHVRLAPRPLLVGVSSMAAWRGGPLAGPYNASKAALSSLLESLRLELAGSNVRVLEVNPGFVRTPMTARNTFPMPFLVEPERAARLIASAMERRRSHLAFPWPTALLMGLVRRLPDPVFDALGAALTRRLRAKGRLRVIATPERGASAQSSPDDPTSSNAPASAR